MFCYKHQYFKFHLSNGLYALATKYIQSQELIMKDEPFQKKTFIATF